MVTRDQLLSAGLNADAIAYRLKVGRLHRVHRGVYAVGHLPPSPHARAMAAVLACGPHAVLSHRSAAALWAITPPWRGPVEVTTRTGRRRPGIDTHRSGTLKPQDITLHYGIPVTTPQRTLEDLKRILPGHSLPRAVNEARLRNLIRHEITPTRSVLEDEFLRFLDRHGLPRPEVNHRIAGYEVDAVWREHRLVVELDGYTTHRHTFEQDRERDAHLLTEGFAVLRLTHRRLTEQPEREARRIDKLLNGEGGIRTLGRG
jgi:very-short-patch-repair endonuclease